MKATTTVKKYKRKSGRLPEAVKLPKGKNQVAQQVRKTRTKKS